jgi:hypothetical protein
MEAIATNEAQILNTIGPEWVKPNARNPTIRCNYNATYNIKGLSNNAKNYS